MSKKCNECPDLEPTPNEGCLKIINSSCVTYDGKDSNCVDVSSGQTLNQVIESQNSHLCDLKQELSNILSEIETIDGKFWLDNINTNCFFEFPTTGTNEEKTQYIINIICDLKNNPSNPLYGVEGCDELGWEEDDTVQQKFQKIVDLICRLSDDINNINETITELENRIDDIEDANIFEGLSANCLSWVSGDTQSQQMQKLLNKVCSNPQIVVSNGLSGNGLPSSHVKLGGELLENTTIEGEFTLNFPLRKIYIIKHPSLYQTSTNNPHNNLFLVEDRTEYPTPIVLNSTSNIKNVFGNILKNTNAFKGTGDYSTTSSIVISHNTIVGDIEMDSDANITNSNGTISSNSISSLNIETHNNKLATNSSIYSLSGVKISGPWKNVSTVSTIENFISLNIRETNAYNVPITNRFAIYQAGASDINRFFGPVQNAGGTTQFTSDIRIKENIIDFNYGLTELEQINTKQFNYTYNKDRKVTGVIAQEIETILPDAISLGNFETPNGENFSDFRMVDSNVIFYTMLNSIKELSTKIKMLEQEIQILKNNQI